MSLNIAIKYFTDFLNSNGDEEIQTKWNDSIKEFKKIFNKKSKKSGPKKNKSAYNIFCAEERLKLKEEFPNLDNKEFFSKLANRWKILKEKDPKKLEEYQRQAEDDKERYLKEKEDLPDDEDGIVKKSKKQKNNGPKKAKSAYMFFCDDERKKITDGTITLSQLGEKWKNAKEKNPSSLKNYELMAQKDKERYNNEKNNISLDEKVEEDNIDDEILVEEEKVEEKPIKKTNKKKVVSKK